VFSLKDADASCKRVRREHEQQHEDMLTEPVQRRPRDVGAGAALESVMAGNPNDLLATFGRDKAHVGADDLYVIEFGVLFEKVGQHPKRYINGKTKLARPGEGRPIGGDERDVFVPDVQQKQRITNTKRRSVRKR